MKDLSDAEFSQLLYLGKKLLHEMDPTVEKVYDESQQNAITIANMFEMTLEFYDELVEEEGENFYERDFT